MKKVLILCIVLMTASAAYGADIKIIANSSTPATIIKKAEAAKIFLGKKTFWDNGDKIMPAVLRSGDAHETFLKQIVEKTSSQFSTYWKQIIFTGKGVEPKSFDTEADMLRFVSETKGAVGYVVGNMPLIGDIKILTVE